MNHGASSGPIRPVRTSSAAPLRTTCVVVSDQDTGRSARKRPRAGHATSSPRMRASAFSCGSRMRAAESSFCAVASRARD